MSMKKYIFTAFITLTLLASFGSLAQDEALGTANKDLKPLIFIIDWLPEPTYLGVYYAADIGEFEKAGYLVTVRPIQGANTVVSSIGNGEYPIGIASGAATVLGRGKGNIPVKSLGVIYEDISSVVYGIASKSMAKKPKDLEGMNVGLYPGSITNDEFEAFIEANHLDESKISKINLTSADIPLLLAGKVDAVLHYNEMSPALVDVRKDIPKVDGKRAWHLLLRDYGVKSYGVNLVTSEKALEEQGDELKKIARAVYNGYEKSCNNRSDAVSKFIERFPDRDKNHIVRGLFIVCDQLIQPIGYQTEKGWQDTIDLFVGLDLLEKGSVIPEDIFIKTKIKSDTGSIDKYDSAAGPIDKHDSAGNVKKSEISMTMCDSNDYWVDVEGEVKNDSKQIIQITMSRLSSTQIGDAPKKGAVEDCISVSDKKTSIDIYFKIKNCDNLFKDSSSADCSLTIKNRNLANHKRELTIGPFIDDYEILQRINNKGIKINQSNLQGITVATTGRFYKAKIEEKHYLTLEW